MHICLIVQIYTLSKQGKRPLYNKKHTVIQSDGNIETEVAENKPISKNRIATPKAAKSFILLKMHSFGLAVNGVPFDPGAIEWHLGDRQNEWQYETTTSGAIPLGLDENHAHVQPQEAYHYHALPTLLLSNLKFSDQKYSPLVGWAPPMDFRSIHFMGMRTPITKIKKLQKNFKLST